MAEQLAHKATSLACEAGTIPLISAIAAAAREEQEAAACTSAYYGVCDTDHEDDADSGTSSGSSANSAVESSSKRHDLSAVGLAAAMLPQGGGSHFRKPTPLRLASCGDNGLCLASSCNNSTQGSDMAGTLTQSGSSITRRLAMAVEAWDILVRFVDLNDGLHGARRSMVRTER